MPDYPLWTAVVRFAGGRAVHYLCDEEADCSPTSTTSPRRSPTAPRPSSSSTRTTPRAAVYSKELLEGILELARRHGLMVLADEIYDKILYDDTEHHCLAALSDDVVTLTFNGLSKSYRVAGFRSGWLVVSGPKAQAGDYLEGLTMLAGMRLCPNVPAQYAVRPRSAATSPSTT
ncbi:hypothetical protein Shyd_57660 [Streptomyces hydrogenans]|uniref:alanine transaminase n=1 Tax=Streptomyces hydrogenans TaxID=1873719 RepID=A0ABQ3PHA9_9ACTN|nr:hypothetical protein Shyd_57660 [Streptomyces hydrogenans]